MNSTKELLGFITLSDYSNVGYVEGFFIRHHEKWSSKYSRWSHDSTKQKLLSAYWTRIIPLHFFILFTSVFVVYLLFSGQHENLTLFVAVIFAYGLAIFIILRFLIYRPLFMNDFLPLLNHVSEKLSGSFLKELESVKKEQYSAVAIVLIQVVTSKLAGFTKPTGSKITKDQLAKLYGISERSFHDALNIVLKGSWKSSPRMDTEIADAFGEAREYFSLTGNLEADKLLDKIKMDVLIKRQPPTY
jgi:hypothetical protein